MAASLNKAQIIGNLAEDPKLNYTQSGHPVTNLRVITNSQYKSGDEWLERAEGHNVVIWGKLAELSNQYLEKGRKVYVEGELQTRKWTDKGGVDHYTTEINAKQVIFLDFGNSNTNGQTPSKPAAKKPAAKKPAAPEPQVEENFDDELPF